jgi:hypothetical protein
MKARDISQALACGNPKCACNRQTGDKWMTHCPAHNDEHPSLSITEQSGRILVKCFAGCEQERIIEALRERGLWRNKRGNLFRDKGVTALYRDKAKPQGAEKSRKTSSRNCNAAAVSDYLGVTLASLAEAKNLSINFLRELGLKDIRQNGQQMVRIPYMDPEGQIIGTRYRVSLNGVLRFLWKKGDKAIPYGLWRLKEIKKLGWVLIVEGESDCWTCWAHNIPALGIPGKTTWKKEWAEPIKGIEPYLWVEPDASELPANLAPDLPGLKVIPAPEGIKDLSEAHLKGQDIQNLLEGLKAKASVADDLLRAKDAIQVEDLKVAAEPVLHAEDPLVLVRKAILDQGYGGEPIAPVIAYLAITSRLLEMRRGAMPVHLLLLGPPSTGKSYALGLALSLMPPEAFHTIGAGSSRVLIYEEADLRHRAVIFGEADSLPTGEDNPAASAIRNLLQDHYLHYKVTVSIPGTRDYKVREINKPGPTVLITTSTRRLGNQLDSRLFSLEVPDDPRHIRLALKTQAALEIQGLPSPDPALIAFQSYLQTKAPWRVVVPFVELLSTRIGQVTTAPRINRDFSRLLSLIKAVAIIRHQQRKLDEEGRIIAQLDDYRVIYELVGKMYEATVSGASEDIRQVVQAVADLLEEGRSPVTYSDIVERLGISKMSVSRRVRPAIKNGWLYNNETRRGFPADLKLGEPLPGRIGLPTPHELEQHCYSDTVTCSRLYSEGLDEHIESDLKLDCNGITPSTGMWRSKRQSLLMLWCHKRQRQAAHDTRTWMEHREQESTNLEDIRI